MTRADVLGLARLHVLKARHPDVAVAAGGDELGAHADVGAFLEGVDGVERHHAAVLDPAVGIDEGGVEAGLQGLAGRMPGELDGLRARQLLARGQMVVEEQAEAHDQAGGCPSRRAG